jgi:lysophospholipase L1-like esterase
LPSAAPIRYVALGDSYTIGTGVREPERWPNQLVERLRAEGLSIELVANLAVNGFTSADLLEVELPAVAEARPDFVSFLVGVNDVVREVPEPAFRHNVRTLIGELLLVLPARRLLAVSTPDYTVTPRGADYGDSSARSSAIWRFNVALAEEADSHGIAFVGIHDVSLAAAHDRSLIAGDGLHPSGAQYALWVDRLAPIVSGLLAIP